MRREEERDSFDILSTNDAHLLHALDKKGEKDAIFWLQPGGVFEYVLARMGREGGLFDIASFSSFSSSSYLKARKKGMRKYEKLMPKFL